METIRFPHREDGVALPTALVGILALSVIVIVIVGFARAELRATSLSTSFETGIHVAETAAELAVAALADVDQTDQPFVAPNEPPGDPSADRDWAVGHALAQIGAGCENARRTAGGDGFAVVDESGGVVYGVGFLPNCQTPTTTRVMRVSYDVFPTDQFSADVTILTGGDIHLTGSNIRLTGGLHANGDIFGTFSNATNPVPVTAHGSCADSRCTPNAGTQLVPNLTARSFWDVRDAEGVNPEALPIIELCDDGVARTGSEDVPCEPGSAPAPLSSTWVFQPTTTGYDGQTWGPTWRWTGNATPPEGIYYGHQVNIISEDNSGIGTSGRTTFIAEADHGALAGTYQGRHSGNTYFTNNAKVFPAWQGVAVVADVDVIFEKNPHHFGTSTLIYAHEQFLIEQNPTISGMAFVACDWSVRSTDFDEDEPGCPLNPNLRSTAGSPIDRVEIMGNATLSAPGDGEILVPNVGITGIADWESLFGG